MMRRFVVLTSTIALAIGMSATAWAGDYSKSDDLVDTAVAAGSFNTLVAAVQAAGLEDALRGDGPYTVFAPTDEAFAALPDGTLDALLANPERLARILKYHVVQGKVMASDVVALESAETLLGQPVSIDASDGVRIGDADVVKTDVKASNGVIHVIDSVLIPKNIVGLAKSAGSFTTLLAAVEAAGLADVLSGDGPYTVFAPTDEAFAKLPEGTVASLLEPENLDKLKAVLKYHVVAGDVRAADVVALDEATTLQGDTLAVATKKDDSGAVSAVHIGEATVVSADLVASNGVVHVVDTVLLPAS
jgi:uncharacterized surface protein with fasciclin (FAS1) repeats